MYKRSFNYMRRETVKDQIFINSRPYLKTFF